MVIYYSYGLQVRVNNNRADKLHSSLLQIRRNHLAKALSRNADFRSR